MSVFPSFFSDSLGGSDYFFYLCIVFFGARHFICSFAARIGTSESERAKTIIQWHAPYKRRLPIG